MVWLGRDAGLQAAFAARPEVSLVKTFYPFEYQGLHEHGPWDLIVIEGWFPMINSFIHEVCRCLLDQSYSQLVHDGALVHLLSGSRTVSARGGAVLLPGP